VTRRRDIATSVMNRLRAFGGPHLHRIRTSARKSHSVAKAGLRLISNRWRSLSQRALSSVAAACWSVPGRMLMGFMLAGCMTTYLVRYSTHDELSRLIASLTQVIAPLLALNLIGMTLTVNQFNQSVVIRKVLGDAGQCSRVIVERFRTARSDKMLRRPFILHLVSATKLEKLVFQTEKSHLYTIRPSWDGAFYWVRFSPFSHRSRDEIGAIATLHEATICAIRALGLILEMRRSKCSLVSERQGTNGSIWFLETLNKARLRYPVIENSHALNELSNSGAAYIISLAMESIFYMGEELRSHEEDVDWTPKEITGFLCFYLEWFIWICFLLQKLFLLRLDVVHRRTGLAKDVANAILHRLNFGSFPESVRTASQLKTAAVSEFSVASRLFWLRSAAKAGTLWAVSFIALEAVVWPAALIKGTALSGAIFFLTYGCGLVAFLESLGFGVSLAFGRRTTPPIAQFDSKPPQ
jgi:hypothetical protein